MNQIACEGISVAKSQEDNRIFDVTVILPEEKRQILENVRQLPIKTAGGLLLPLEEFAT